VQDTVGVASGEVLRAHSLAERELPRERPLEPIGDNDLLAVAIVRDALGLDRQDDVLDGHLDAVKVGAGQVGLDMVAAVLAAVDVHGDTERGTRPARGHGQEPIETPGKGPGRARTRPLTSLPPAGVWCLPGNHVRPRPMWSSHATGSIPAVPHSGLTTYVLTCEQICGLGAPGVRAFIVAPVRVRARARVPGPGKPTSGSYSFRRTIQVETMGGSLR
jgi:hypothetical protein